MRALLYELIACTFAMLAVLWAVVGLAYPEFVSVWLIFGILFNLCIAYYWHRAAERHIG